MIDALSAVSYESAGGRPEWITDIKWARMQPKLQNNYVGDVVKFHGGGVCLITDVSRSVNRPRRVQLSR